jgi:hypothetical protein
VASTYVTTFQLPSGQMVVVYRDQANVTHTVGPMQRPDAEDLERRLEYLMDMKRES